MTANQLIEETKKMDTAELAKLLAYLRTRQREQIQLAAIESAEILRGQVIVRFETGLQIRFPVAISPRLVGASKADLRNIEVSPFGLHWPDLDEDLSFAGLLSGRAFRSVDQEDQL